MIKRQLLRYLLLSKPVKLALGLEFFTQIINATFLLIFNNYLITEGYPDYQAGEIVSYRYLGILLIAFPLGLLLKNQKLAKYLLFASIVVPISSMGLMYSAHMKWSLGLNLFQGLWGIAYGIEQVTIIPYLLRNGDGHLKSETFALKFACWSIATLIGGLLIFVLPLIHMQFWSEYHLLMLFSASGFLGVYFAWKLRKYDVLHIERSKKIIELPEKWSSILLAQVPPLLISLGAGLAIPFVNLFFLQVHHWGSQSFSILGAISSVLVTVGFFAIPYFKRTYGYTVSVNYFQYAAVIALSGLAFTDWLNEYSWAASLAAIFFLLRQPLMNMAAPMASELVMDYSGKENRELVSAIQSGLNSGSWFISALIFKNLRQAEVSYGSLLLFTAFLYFVATLIFQLLINKLHKGDHIS